MIFIWPEAYKIEYKRKQDEMKMVVAIPNID
jgi:hypothetical protein